MNVGDLMRELARLPADMPVEMALDNELVVSVYSVGGVCYIDFNEPATLIVDSDCDIVDAEVVERGDERTVDCPQCGDTLRVSVTTLPGDYVYCSRCVTMVQLRVPLRLEVCGDGPGWEALLGRQRAAIEGYDRDTRTLATADQAHTDIDRPGRDAFVTMPAVLAAIDARVGRCVACGEPSAPGVLCPECAGVLNGRRR